MTDPTPPGASDVTFYCHTCGGSRRVSPEELAAMNAADAGILCCGRFLMHLTPPGASETELLWTPWNERRPTEPGHYWWRVPFREIGAMQLQPEWTEELYSCGMGYGPNEHWPGFSDWDGYRRTVPAGTEWRPATPEEKGLERWGLDVASCPFCGHVPELGWLWQGGSSGVIIGGRPYQADTFWLKCKNCRFAHTPHYKTLYVLLNTWNNRAALGETGLLGGGERDEEAVGLLREIVTATDQRWDMMTEGEWEGTIAPARDRAAAFLASRSSARGEPSGAWRPIESAPKDGTAVLCYGVHVDSPPDAQQGVLPGDHWWGILVFDVWREPSRGWVFAKDGAKAWSPPTHWQPLQAPAPPGSTPGSARGEPSGTWRGMESAPKDKPVLVAAGRIPRAAYFAPGPDGIEWWDYESHAALIPIAWMPLPPLPAPPGSTPGSAEREEKP